MANEYEFTSGFLGARQLKQDKQYKDAALENQREELRVKKPYYESATDENLAKAGVYRETAKDARLKRGMTIGRARALKKNNMLGDDWNINDYIDDDSYMGVEGAFKPMSKAPSFGLTQPPPVQNGTDPQAGMYGLRLPTVRGYVHGGLVQHYNDGSQGGVQPPQALSDDQIAQKLGIKPMVDANGMMSFSPDDQARVDQARGITVGGNRVEGNGTFEVVQDLRREEDDRRNGVTRPIEGTTEATKLNTTGLNAPKLKSGDGPTEIPFGEKAPYAAVVSADPKAAKEIYNDVWKKTSNFKNLSKTLMELQSFDFIEGKVTTKGMLDNVQTLKKMQNEGFFSAVNEAIYGDNKKALEMFREYGDDKAENVKSLTTFDIQEDVTNSKTKEKRKGVLVTYDDGTTRKVDPKKLIMDAVTVKEFLDESYRRSSQIVAAEDKDRDRDENAALRRLQIQERKDRLDKEEQEKVSKRMSSEFTGEFNREFKTFLDPSNPNFIPDQSKRDEKAREIDEKLRPAQTLGQANIAAGNFRINSANLMTAVQNAANPDFLGNPNNFVKGKDGKPLVKEVLGQTMAQTNGGVWIPVGIGQR
jgi:hypothetical protein